MRVDMPYAQALQERGELPPELRAVVRLDAAEREGNGAQEARKSSADGARRSPLQDSGRQKTAAVIDAGELEAALGEALEVHLSPLAGKGFGIADPVGLGLARTTHKRATASQDAIHAAQAAGKHASSPERCLETVDAVYRENCRALVVLVLAAQFFIACHQWNEALLLDLASLYRLARPFASLKTCPEPAEGAGSSFTPSLLSCPETPQCWPRCRLNGRMGDSGPWKR